MPSHPPGDAVPHYKLVLIDAVRSTPDVDGDALAARCDGLLRELNCEYEAKRASGRLGCVRFARTSPGEFAARLGDSRRADVWEAQFKFLPLYRGTWESHDAPPAPERAVVRAAS